MVKLDSLDRRILSIICENARTPFKDVAEQCGVSRAAIHQRVLRLQEQGVITGSGYQVNPKTLGYSTCTYVGVKLERACLYREVVPMLFKIPEVIECHYTTGPYSMLIKMYAKDNLHLMHILSAAIQEIPGIIATETLISLDMAFVRNIPIPQEDR
ncbi:MAG: Lrp/AsnC ligand binding domain-containing protein [Porphyromonas sp.]|nr:Lrp/AsnC ligand binding domain-containing protein [Porphyromonas sp.]